MRSQWGEARESRLQRNRNLPASGAGADYRFHNEYHYYHIVEQARSMEAEDAVVGPSIRMARRNTVGPNGFSFDPKTESKRYNEQWWERFQEYCEDKDQCDVTGERTFTQQCGVAFGATLVSGDCLMVGVEEDGVVKLQAYESDQIKTPPGLRTNDPKSPKKVVLGVQMDRFRKREGYHIANRNTAAVDIVRDEDLRFIDLVHPNLNLQQAFHIYSATRFSQTRGVSCLYPAFGTADYFEDINFAKLVQSLAVSCIGFIEETPLDSETINRTPNSGTSDTDDPAAPYLGLRQRLMEELFPGFRLKTKPGHKIVPFSPNTPNPEFFMHAKMMLQIIGINIGIPLVMLLMDASETNFSGWRGAVQEAKEGFVDNQTMMIETFLRPFMRLWTAVEIAHGRLTPPKNVTNPYRHTWKGRAWPYIEPLKDANAQAFRMRNLLSSPRRVHMELSQEWETEVDDTVADNSYAILRAMKASAKLEEKAKELKLKNAAVPWQYLLSLPTLDRVSGTLSIDTSGEPKQVKPPGAKPAPSQGASK